MQIKMTLRDKMTKKSGGGTPGLSLSDNFFKFDRGTGTYVGKVLVYLSPLMILYYV